MELIQIVPTLGEPCGISNLAAQLDTALATRGIAVCCSRSWTGGAQVVLLHYHPDLMTPAEVARGVAAARGPVLLLPHEKPEALASVRFDGYVYTFPPPGDHGRPALMLGHPAWAPPRLRPRAEVRGELGLPQDTMILGSCGATGTVQPVPPSEVPVSGPQGLALGPAG